MSGRTSRHMPYPAGNTRAGQGHEAVSWTRLPSLNEHPIQDQAPVPSLPPGYPGEQHAHGWPLQDFVELSACDRSVPRARHHAQHVLREWELTPLVASTELVVSELVTNAISASRCLDWPHPVRMWLLSDLSSILVLAWDASPHPPLKADPIAEAEDGRGLLLVEALSMRWSWFPASDLNGKVTWALLAE
jgi:anti-sigma regulatory factor (Ser/Thr protein kinase)